MSPSDVTADVKADAKAEVAQTNGNGNGNGAVPQEVDGAGSDDEEEPKEETTKSQAEQSNALNKLTDVVEDTQMDGDKMKEAFQLLRKQEEADKEAERKREKQLAAVKVKKEDVQLIAREMELTVQQADRKLREADGDVVACLHVLVA